MRRSADSKEYGYIAAGLLLFLDISMHIFLILDIFCSEVSAYEFFRKEKKGALIADQEAL